MKEKGAAEECAITFWFHATGNQPHRTHTIGGDQSDNAFARTIRGFVPTPIAKFDNSDSQSWNFFLIVCLRNIRKNGNNQMQFLLGASYKWTKVKKWTNWTDGEWQRVANKFQFKLCVVVVGGAGAGTMIHSIQSSLTMNVTCDFCLFIRYCHYLRQRRRDFFTRSTHFTVQTGKNGFGLHSDRFLRLTALSE